MSFLNFLRRKFFDQSEQAIIILLNFLVHPICNVGIKNCVILPIGTHDGGMRFHAILPNRKYDWLLQILVSDSTADDCISFVIFTLASRLMLQILLFYCHAAWIARCRSSSVPISFRGGFGSI